MSVRKFVDQKSIPWIFDIFQVFHTPEYPGLLSQAIGPYCKVKLHSLSHNESKPSELTS